MSLETSSLREAIRQFEHSLSADGWLLKDCTFQLAPLGIPIFEVNYCPSQPANTTIKWMRSDLSGSSLTRWAWASDRLSQRSPRTNQATSARTRPRPRARKSI